MVSNSAAPQPPWHRRVGRATVLVLLADLALEGYAAVALLAILMTALVPIDLLLAFRVPSTVPWALSAMVPAGLVAAYLGRAMLEYPRRVWLQARALAERSAGLRALPSRIE